MQLTHNNSLFSEEEITKTAQTLLPYIATLQKYSSQPTYDNFENSMNLPGDEKLLNDVQNIVSKIKTAQLRYVIVIGIGGSNLGTKAVYDAIFGTFDQIEPNRFPKIIFADTTDPEFSAKLIHFLSTNISSEEEVVVNTISKSGGTAETMVNFELVRKILCQRFPTITERMVITTDDGSKLHQMAREKKYQTLTLPKVVGGRYSVFSAVGLLPLSLASINISRLRDGASSMKTLCLDEDYLKNPALLSATLLYLHALKGLTINDNFFFHLELESLGKWYRQLMGESIGKEGKGITPTVSVGSNDLHSMAQLYWGGPKNKYTTLVYTQKMVGDSQTPPSLEFPGLTSDIENKKASDIMNAIYQGVKLTYQKLGLPTMEILLDDTTEFSLGQFLQFKMIEMMYLAKLLRVNAFDQPHVELYKTETKSILKKS